MRTITLTLILIALMAMTVTAQNEMEIVWEALGENHHDHFGDGVCGGDFNNDGYSDVLIAAGGWNDNQGKNYLYFGSPDFFEVPSMFFLGDTTDDGFGLSISNIQDVSGDGIDDILIPAYYSPEGGWAEIYFTGEQLDTVPDWRVGKQAPEIWDYFGIHTDSTGDVNGDGWSDFVISGGVSFGDSNYFEIYFGGLVLDTIPDFVYSTELLTNYPFEVEGLSDVNGDGFDDILAYKQNDEFPGLLFFGGNPMDTIPDLEFHEFVAHASGVGDVNDDGYPDIAMNQHFNDSTGFDVVYFGGPDIDNVNDAELLHNNGTHGHSTSLSCGDFNGDGITDIACISIWNISWLYVYLGSSELNGRADVEWSSSDMLADNKHVTGVGDVDNDGCDDLLFGAQNFNSAYRGKAILFAGNPDLIDLGAAIEPGEIPHIPGWFILGQNYPNPFNASTLIHFELGKPSIINMTVYDVRGNRIRNIIENKQLLPGGYNVSWRSIDQQNQPVSSGIYLLELQVDQYKEMRKMVLAR